MKSSRRHDSLVPLSREHHYGLMVCLRIHRGLPIHRDDRLWLERKREQAIQFFESDLLPHFKAEEEILFPSMQTFAGASGLISELLFEHDKMRLVVETLRDAKQDELPSLLSVFADLLESHIRKEERQLFPIYEQQATEEIASAVERAIIDLIGTAMRPKNPDLLK
ncbi:MAG TPA: hemerythrin domain-containing protein [Blastocatellia bacterium]|nr:hemerythrin domain-containing protein [Blastocatellia bacterium]